MLNDWKRETTKHRSRLAEQTLENEVLHDATKQNEPSSANQKSPQLSTPVTEEERIATKQKIAKWRNDRFQEKEELKVYVLFTEVLC